MAGLADLALRRPRALLAGNLAVLALAVLLAAVILIVGATVPSQGVPPFIYFQF